MHLNAFLERYGKQTHTETHKTSAIFWPRFLVQQLQPGLHQTCPATKPVSKSVLETHR